MKIIALWIVLVLLVGCQSAVEKKLEKDIERETGGDADVDITGRTVKVETDEGKFEAKAGADEWCSEGSTWKMTGAEGEAEMVILGIVDSGKYKGYCHMTYDIDMEDAMGKIDYYYDEDGNGYQVMDMNGQKMEMSWSKE